jgi:hypothetical protein
MGQVNETGGIDGPETDVDENIAISPTGPPFELAEGAGRSTTRGSNES